MSETVQLELLKGAIGLVTPVLTAVLLYFVGRYLTDRYSEQKKRAELALLQVTQSAQKQRELQLVAAARFYELYGEFFAVWKQWSAFKAGKLVPRDPEAFRVGLFERACAGEGNMEAVLVRIASEFRVEPVDIETLGRFRQAYQTLREALRENHELGWNDPEHPQYAAFKRLACLVASLLGRHTLKELPTPEEAAAVLKKITDVTFEGGRWAK